MTKTISREGAIAWLEDVARTNAGLGYQSAADKACAAISYLRPAPADDGVIGRTAEWLHGLQNLMEYNTKHPDCYTPEQKQELIEREADLRTLIALARQAGATGEHPVSVVAPSIPRFVRHPMATAPKDHRPLWLLLDYTKDDVGPLDDAALAWTLGHNGFKHTGEDYWQVVAWSWEQDVYYDTRDVTPLAWCPIGGEISEDDAAPPPTVQLCAPPSDAVAALVAACEPFVRTERCLGWAVKDDDLFRTLDPNFERGSTFQARDFRRLATAVAALAEPTDD